MGKNRDRLSIIAAILIAASSGASKTRIMNAANLSFNLLEKYLAVSVNAGLIELTGQRYQLTQQGKDYIREFRQFQENYEKVQTLLEDLESKREKLENLCGCPTTEVKTFYP